MRAIFLALSIAAAPLAASAEPLQQLRAYEIVGTSPQALHDRFRDHAMRIMRRHGFTIITVWEGHSPAARKLIYLLEWPNEAAMKTAWTAFMADPEWTEIKRTTGARHGRMIGSIEDYTLRPTAYSPDRSEARPAPQG